MPMLTVELPEAAMNSLNELAERSGEPIETVLNKAVEVYRQKEFLRELSADFTRLRKDEQAWNEELEERRAWDSTLADGQEQA